MPEDVEISYGAFKNSKNCAIRDIEGWETTRRDNVEWLTNDQLNIASNNAEVVAVSSAVPGGIATAAIAIVSGILAPVTVGLSLVVGALAGGGMAAVTASAAAGVGVHLSKKAREVNETLWTKMVEKLTKDNACTENVNLAIQNLLACVNQLIANTVKIDDQKGKHLSEKLKVKTKILQNHMTGITISRELPGKVNEIKNALKVKADELEKNRLAVDMKGRKAAIEEISKIIKNELSH